MMTDKGIRQGACYFLIHALVEVVCFTILSEYYVRSGGILWAVALLFDTVAFVPQGINKREVVRAYADSGKGSQLF